MNFSITVRLKTDCGTQSKFWEKTEADFAVVEKKTEVLKRIPRAKKDAQSRIVFASSEESHCIAIKQTWNQLKLNPTLLVDIASSEQIFFDKNQNRGQLKGPLRKHSRTKKHKQGTPGRITCVWAN